MRKFQLGVKRTVDIICAVLLILFLTAIPVLIVIPIAIKLNSKGPAVFTQERMGKDGKVFKIYKFRTMRIPEESLDENGNMLEPQQRITGVGAFLRKTSLDELMQVFNVLNGTMSIVGPRPSLPYQADNYTERQHGRFKMRPGITGWAQVNGRNELTWTEKIEYDLEYIENYSLWFDIKILFRTVTVVFKHEGIAFEKHDAITVKPGSNAESQEEMTATIES